jgi:isopropylmalate/homocitrate/citramalate synthase
MRAEPTAIVVCEVGPRDGLQNEERVLSVADRVALVDRLSACRLPRIEVGSFVNTRRVPQMADTERVFDAINRRPDTAYVGLSLNVRGAERAIASGVDRLNFAFVVTETFNQRNQGRTVNESLRELRRVVSLASAAGVPTTAILGASFGCPFEGPVPPERVIELATAARSCGADEISFADTIGVAVPAQVTAVARRAREVLPHVRLGCHLHNTRNTGIANAVAALDAGITLLDASVGGAGGCPFAPRATGNIATEDLLYLLDGTGVATGVDTAALIETAQWLEQRLGHRLPGMVKDAGLDWHGSAA